MAESVFGAWDYAIIAATMIVPVAMGIYFRFSGGKQKTNEEYLLADRNMSILPVAVSLVASFMSAITLLGVSAENHYYGMIFILVNVSNGLGTPIATKFYLPVFFCLQKTSTYEYLELRFGPNIRTLASLTYTVQMILYNGIVLYAPAIVLESVTGFDRFVSILVVGLACTFYSTLGGMKAVLFTDLLQSLLMFGAVLSIVVFCSIQLGGFGEIFRIAYEGGRINFNNFSPDPTQRHTWWSLLCGGIITYLSLYGVNHTQIDQLMPYYVVDVMNSVPGLAGLFVAGIFSASLSTISAACNSLAAVTLSDYVGRYRNQNRIK